MYLFNIYIGLPRWSSGKNLPAKQETWVQSLGLEDPLEKEVATHCMYYSCLGNPFDREAWQAAVYGVAKELAITLQLNNSSNILLGNERLEFSVNGI